MLGFHCGFGQQTFWRVGAAVVLGLSAATPLHAQPRVAIVASAATSLTDPRFTDPQAKIAATGLFSAVDIISVTSPNPTPTLAELLQYDAIIVWSNNAFTDRVAMGNVLADYVDAGGGVVLAVFVVNSTTSGLQGRWLNENYAIFVPGSGNATTNATLGTVEIPGHPILDGVLTLSSSTSTTSNSRANTASLTPHGAMVVRWSDGLALAAVSTMFPSRVDLGLYPPSSAVTSTFWDQSTDGGRLMANALLYAANATGIPGTDLLTTVSAPAACSTTPGGSLSYTVRLRNIGADASGPVSLVVDLPAAMVATYSSATPMPTTVTATQLTFALPAIAGGTFTEVGITLTAVGAGQVTTISATATTTGETNTGNNSASAGSLIRPAVPGSASATAIFTTNTALANSTIPGPSGGQFTVLDKPVSSPSGAWWAIRADTNLPTASDQIVVRSQTGGSPTLLLQEGASSLENGLLTVVDAGMEIGDSGVLAFSGDDAGATASDEFVATTDGTTITDVAREGFPVPSIPGVTYGVSSGSVNILASGQVGFSFTSTPTGSTGYFSSNGNAIVAQLGVTQPTGASNTIDTMVTNVLGDGGFMLDASGANSIYQADILGEAATTDQVIVANGTVVMQEGVTILSGLTSPVNGTTKTFSMSPGGVWMVRGSNSTATEDWVVRGTGSTIQQVYKVGDPIFTGATETWQEDSSFTATFFLNAADAAGNYVIGGLTSEPDSFRDAVLVLNNQTVLARENDPIDLNGDGMFNDGAYIRTFGNDDIAFIGDAVLLTVTYRNEDAALCGSNNADQGSALIRVPLPSGSGACCIATECSITAGPGGCAGSYQGNGTACGTPANPTTCCPANFNGIGGVTVQDIFDFLAAYFLGLPSADINGVGGVTVQDIFDYLTIYFVGC